MKQVLKRFVLAAGAAAMLMGVAGTAEAGPIFTASTLPGCSNCFGLTYSLTVGDAGDAVATTFDATLKVTGTLTGAGSVTRISAVSFKVANDAIPPLVLTAAPTDLASWLTTENNINNSGCEGSGNGFVCSEATTTAALAVLTGGPVNLTWSWTFNLAPGVTPTAKHIGAKLNNSTGTLNGKIVSQDQFTTVSVPDGGVTLSLLGLALTAVGFAKRRLG